MEKFRGTIFTTCVLLVVALELSAIAICQAADSNLPSAIKGKYCNYTVIIETTCTKGAATSNHVSLRFGDIKSNDIVIKHLNTKHMRQVDPLQPAVYDEAPKKAPFQVCTVDEFQVTGQCVETPVCYLYIKSMGNDAWRPGIAQVRVSGASHLSSTEFYFRRYLPQHVWHGHDKCETVVTPFGIKHNRKVFAKKQY